MDEIRLNNDSKKVLKEGVLFNTVDNVWLEDGCFTVSVISMVNVDKMIEKEVFSEYLYSPLQRSFSLVVRITGDEGM